MKSMKIQSFSDIITNSSSELFVFDDGKSVEEVIQILDEIYPDWRNEYDTPEMVKNLDLDDIELYQGYADELYWKEDECLTKTYGEDCKCNYSEAWKNFDKTKSYYYKYAKQVCKKPEELYIGWENYNPLAPYGSNYERYLDYTELFYELFRERHKNEVLLCSLDENPDWKYQEKLETVAKRYHLG